MPKRLDRLAIPSAAGVTRVVIDRTPPPPAVRVIGLAQSGPQWSHAPHRHDAYELHYIRRGSGTLIAGERRFATSAGDIYLFRPSEDHGGWADARDPAQVLYLAFTLPSEVEREAFVGAIGDKPLFLHEDAPELRAELRALADEVAALAPEPGGDVARAAPLSVVARSLRVLAAVLEPARRRTLASGTSHERELAESVLREAESRACAGALPVREVAPRRFVGRAGAGARAAPRHRPRAAARAALSGRRGRVRRRPGQHRASGGGGENARITALDRLWPG